MCYICISLYICLGNSNIQKIVAFENAFDKLVEIMEFEGKYGMEREKLTTENK